MKDELFLNRINLLKKVNVVYHSVTIYAHGKRQVHNKIISLRLRKKAVFRAIIKITENLVKLR